uniref:Sema domain-containing protein n=1 Tax=Tetraodon nigroviridis TaxID=99883 RepID=H3CGU4_TETNG
PIASAVPLQATPTFNSSIQLTAVTTATEAEHTIAFLGDREGHLHKLTRGFSGNTATCWATFATADELPSFRCVVFKTNSQQHLYVLSNSRLSKVPVSSCEGQTDCQSCLAVRDPYCGWCVLEGRCSRKHLCRRHSQPNHWLWSFEPTSGCVAVQSLQPARQSRDQQTQVTLSVGRLPALAEAESLSCVFGLLPPGPAIVMGTSITCQSPVPELLQPMQAGSDHMALPVSLVFGHVTIATSSMTFYDCAAFRCLACVGSAWGCNWCPLDQLCTHNLSCPSQHIILSQRVRQDSPGPTSCPLVFGLQSSALVPLGVSTSLVLRGRNLDVYTKDEAQYECVVEMEGVQHRLAAAVEKSHDNTDTFTCSPHTGFALSQLQYSVPVYLRRGERRIDASPGLRIQLYDCSAGQSDCSQCRAVPAEYGCVWCPGSPSPSCVYNQSCSSTPEDSCPPPQITQVQPVSGPLEGGVLVTITGSNLGMRYQDVVGGITVAGIWCPPFRPKGTRSPPGLSAALSVVCELQPSGKQREGPVQVRVGAAPPGRSLQVFTYQDPQLLGLVPDKGPVSGGTRLTIRGRQLLTG